MRMRNSWSVLLALLLSACFGPAVPNEDLVRACRNEPPDWRRQTIITDVLLVADWVNLMEPQLRWTNTAGVQPGHNPCSACTSMLLRGFSSVEYLPASATDLNTVWRYTFADDGDARCQFIENRNAPIGHPPVGKCLAVERDVPRAARYAVHFYNTRRDAQWLDVWTYELIDLS